jgi:hypothetical protein
LTGYCLDQFGKATQRREVFVQVAGIQVLPQVGRAGLAVQPWANRTVRRRGV